MIKFGQTKLLMLTFSPNVGLEISKPSSNDRIWSDETPLNAARIFPSTFVNKKSIFFNLTFLNVQFFFYRFDSSRGPVSANRKRPGYGE